MIVNIVPQGYASRVPHSMKAEGVVLEMPIDTFMVSRLLDFPDDAEFHLRRPPGVSHEWWKPFEEDVTNALRGRHITSCLYKQNKRKWVENAFRNYGRLINDGMPATALPKARPDDMAWIVGNGPSLLPNLHLIKDSEHIFSAWHNAYKLVNHGIQPHIIGHADIHPCWDTIPQCVAPFARLLASPTCAPEFLQAFPDNQAYAYTGQDVWVHALFAEALNCKDMEPVLGSVASLLVWGAILSGYKRITFLGVDLSCPTADDPYLKGSKEKIVAVQSNCGQTVYTDEVMTAYRIGLESMIEVHPAIKFYNASPTGVKIKGTELYDL